MRRFEQNLGEKRVLLGSLQNKNNLRVTCEKLSLEEKAFISSTQFNRRQLLSRQTKLRQLQKQSGKGRETRQSQTSLPVLPKVNENTIRSYSSNLTLPYPRKGPRSPGEEKRISSLFGKEDRGGTVKSDNSPQSNIEGHFINIKDESPEKRNEMKTISKKKLLKVETGLKSKQVEDLGLQVGDLLAYSGSFDKEKPTTGRLVNRKDRSEKQISEFANKNKNLAFEKQTVWKDDLDSSYENISTVARYQEIEDINKHIFTSNGNVLNSADNRQRSPRVVKTTLKESAYNGDESTLVPITVDWFKNTNDTTPKTVMTASTNSPSGELKSESSFIVSSSEHSQKSYDLNVSFQESDNPNVPINLKFESSQQIEDHTERASANVPVLVSRTPSWNGTEDIPALGRIRRGSFCDVKTFTSGKVLDLLSSCKLPLPGEKTDKQFLKVENEDLKYCRYLRSVTPEHASGESEIPLKYRPSKNIIIGHTKIAPF